MTSRTSREAQQWLQAYRASLSPDERARERALRELTQRVVRGELPRVPAPEPPHLPSRSESRSKLATRGPRAVAVTLAAVGGACALLAAVSLWHGQRRPAARHGSAATSSVVRQPPARDTPPPGESRQKAEQAPAPAPLVATSPVARAPGAVVHRPGQRERTARGGVRHAVQSDSGPAPSASKPAAAQSGGGEEKSDLDAELLLMRSAYQALRAGDPQRALARLAEHAARFPTGQLAESRQVARIMALCQAGQVPAANAEAEAFLRVSPKSPFVARLRSLCVAPLVQALH
jgi:hypothetical protein